MLYSPPLALHEIIRSTFYYHSLPLIAPYARSILAQIFSEAEDRFDLNYTLVEAGHPRYRYLRTDEVKFRELLDYYSPPTHSLIAAYLANSSNITPIQVERIAFEASSSDVQFLRSKLKMNDPLLIKINQIYKIMRPPYSILL